MRKWLGVVLLIGVLVFIGKIVAGGVEGQTGEVELLRQIRKQQIEMRLAAGPVWQDVGFVFTRPDGRPIDPDAPTHDFTAIVRSASLPHLTLQGLRHAHATLMLTAGIHPKVVSERLGHSNIAITMDIYSHVLPGLQEAAAQALDELLAQ